MDRLEDV